MKGIVLAGGSGTRLHPLTLGVSKQLLPVYNKPMIYYPISVLLLAGIKEILIITTPEEQHLFKRLLGDGEKLGCRFTYAIQPQPKGLAEAFIIGEEFIGDDRVCLILGDNIFYGNRLHEFLNAAVAKEKGATLFGYEVKSPQRYGVAEVNDEGVVISLEEKPMHPKSNIAVTGLYFYDNDVIRIAKEIKPSGRGELEITDVNRVYMEKGLVSMHVMGRGFTWLDAGTYESLMQASHFVQVVEERQGMYIASLEEIAYHQEFITAKQLRKLGQDLGKSPYGQYLIELSERKIEITV
ncbi:Glucose-1-phosphate thymidylyltransferase 1 [Candidatus Rubidus massiliensis]|nr:Glucose-1-phosphate thymidylyltransferase 1 [Candidatus Rubidus massiliensis]